MGRLVPYIRSCLSRLAGGLRRLGGWLAILALSPLTTVHTASSAEDEAVNRRTLPLFLSAHHPFGEGFVRIINHSAKAGEVRIFGVDDSGERYGPAALSMASRSNAHFRSIDLELGNPDRGIADGIGQGQGDWRLEFETSIDIEVMGFVRTHDGFVTSVLDVIEQQGDCWRLPIVNPGRNDRQRSLVRLTNTNDDSVEVSISARDDHGVPGASTVVLTLAPGVSRTLSALQLEEGGGDLVGRLGAGQGKWQLAVVAEQPIQVMNLLESPTGHLSNLSLSAPFGSGRCWAARSSVDGSIVEYLEEPLADGKSPGLFVAIVDQRGLRAIAANGVRRNGSPNGVTPSDLIHIGSNTKAMTATMLATLVSDGTFDDGWQTTLSSVFPESLDEIHASYHSVSLRQLVSMTGGLPRDARNWWAHSSLDIIQQRQAILRENLEIRPAGPVGNYLYSNLSYLVAGAMAEKVTGKAWETLMEEQLFTPLGMSTAGFGVPGTHGEVDQPWGHVRSESGQWQPYQRDNPAALGPAGTVHLTLADWAKFIGLWLPGRQPPILDRTKLDELTIPVAEGYAAGWGVATRSWAEGVALNHWGSNRYWYTVLWVAPNLNRAFIAAANSADDDTFTMLDQLVGHLIAHVHPPAG